MIYKFLKQSVIGRRGQTLIEVVITLGIALIIITSILVLVNASNRRATIARQATQASKLAQEGMEIVRNIRDEELDTVYVSCSTTPCNWKDLYSSSIGTIPACIYLDTAPTPNEWNLYPPTNSKCDAEKVGGSLGGPPGSGIFERKIEISDDNIPPPGPSQICTNSGSDYKTVKRISVKITWESPIGDQDREVISCLTNWR